LGCWAGVCWHVTRRVTSHAFAHQCGHACVFTTNESRAWRLVRSLSRHVRAGVATVAIICSSINVWHWQHWPRTVEALNGTRVPKQLSFSVVWSPWPWSFHEDTTARSPPRPTVHLLRSILDLPSARWDVGWSCPTQPSRATPSAHATPLHFVRIVYPLSRLFMSINLSVYHLPRSLHSSVNALLSSSAPSARRTEAFCLCVCKSVCTCVCVCMHVCVCVSGVSAHVYPGPRLLGLGQLQPCWWQLSQCQTNP